MTINEVYKLVQIFANKEQRGFITPSDFNLLAQQAELELYNKRLDIVKEKSQPKKVAGYYAKGLAPEIAEQDLIHFSRIEEITLSNSNDPSYGTYTDKTMDYISHITIKSDEEHNLSTNVPVDIVTPDTVNQILRSSLVKPSMSYPIALISGASSGGKRIILFPETISRCVVYYYRYQNKPEWSYVSVSGKPVYNHSTSSQFTLSARCHGELVVKILEYLGVNLREADVVQYASGKEIQQDN